MDFWYSGDIIRISVISNISRKQGNQVFYRYMYRVSHKKVYLFETSISQAPNIGQKKFSTRNKSMNILFQKREENIILVFWDIVDPLLILQK